MLSAATSRLSLVHSAFASSKRADLVCACGLSVQLTELPRLCLDSICRTFKRQGRLHQPPWAGSSGSPSGSTSRQLSSSRSACPVTALPVSESACCSPAASDPLTCLPLLLLMLLRDCSRLGGNSRAWSAGSGCASLLARDRLAGCWSWLALVALAAACCPSSGSSQVTLQQEKRWKFASS